MLWSFVCVESGTLFGLLGCDACGTSGSTCFGGSCCIHLLGQANARSTYLQGVRYCLPNNTVSNLRRLEVSRQNVIMTQVSVADYSHVGYGTALVGNLLPLS